MNVTPIDAIRSPGEAWPRRGPRPIVEGSGLATGARATRAAGGEVLRVVQLCDSSRTLMALSRSRAYAADVARVAVDLAHAARGDVAHRWIIRERRGVSRFCWFSFDNVSDVSADGWSTVIPRDGVRAAGAEGIVRELEALLIKVLGARQQNQMRFLEADPWQQVTLTDCQPGECLTKVDRAPILQPEFVRALDELSPDDLIEPSRDRST